MKKSLLNIFLAIGLLLLNVPIMAQEEVEITDEDLWKYAMAMEVVDQMKKDISTEINGLIKMQEGMTGKRYVELAATKGDAEKLAAIEAQDWEIKFLETTNELKETRTDAIKMVFNELATKMIGNNGKTYKKVKELVANDGEIKARYESIKEALSASIMSS